MAVPLLTVEAIVMGKELSAKINKLYYDTDAVIDWHGARSIKSVDAPVIIDLKTIRDYEKKEQSICLYVDEIDYLKNYEINK